MTQFKAGAKVRASELQATRSRYYSTDTSTTIATGGTISILKYAVADGTSSNVTASGTGNTTFTVNKTGIWLLTASSRVTFSTQPTSGDMTLYIAVGTTRIAAESHPAPYYVNLSPVFAAGTVRTLTSGDAIQAALINATNQIATVNYEQNFVTHISLTLLQGL